MGLGAEMRSLGLSIALMCENCEICNAESKGNSTSLSLLASSLSSGTGKLTKPVVNPILISLVRQMSRKGNRQLLKELE